MYMHWNVVEGAAASFNLAANASLTVRLCTAPHAPVPVLVLALQVSANLCWAWHALRAGDGSLLATASSSLSLQAISLALRVLARRKDPPEDLSSSRDALWP